MITHDDIVELIAETITELSSACRCSLPDLYGSFDGFHIVDVKSMEQADAIDNINPDDDGAAAFLLERWQDRMGGLR